MMNKEDRYFPLLTKLEQCKILVVGDLMLDRYWFGNVDRVSPEAPVPVVHVKESQDRLGGAANVARNITALGAKAAVLGIVGQDEGAACLRRLAQEAGIEMFLLEDALTPTTMKMRVLGRQQQLIRVDFEAKPSPQIGQLVLEKFQAVVADYDVVIFSDYAKGVLEHVQAMIQIAHKAKVRVLVDPKGGDYSRYRGAYIITPNRSEISQVIGAWHDEQELAMATQALRTELDLHAVLVTRSEEGMSLFNGDGVFHVPALAREVFDVSGAGDTVIACLAVMQAAEVSLPDSMHWANLAGSVVVGKLGTSTVSYDELSAARAVH